MASLQVRGREVLTTGSINSLDVCFEYARGWDNLCKTAVFSNGDNNISVLLNDETCTIPWEVLQSAGKLYISLRGTNSGGELVICTENALVGTVKPSLAAAVAAGHHEATPDVIDALVSDVAELKNGHGGVGSNGKSAYELALDNGFDGSLNEWLLSLHGTAGANGADGYTPVKGVDYFTSADKSELVSSVLAELPNGDEVSY